MFMILDYIIIKVKKTELFLAATGNKTRVILVDFLGIV